MFRKFAVAVASVAAVATMAAGPASAASNISIRHSLGGHDAATVTFTMTGGWSASVHVSSLPKGSYVYYVSASGKTASGSPITWWTQVCTITMKTAGVGDCGGTHLNIAPGFSPTSFGFELASATSGNAVKAGKF